MGVLICIGLLRVGRKLGDRRVGGRSGGIPQRSALLRRRRPGRPVVWRSNSAICLMMGWEEEGSGAETTRGLARCFTGHTGPVGLQFRHNMREALPRCGRHGKPAARQRSMYIAIVLCLRTKHGKLLLDFIISNPPLDCFVLYTALLRCIEERGRYRLDVSTSQITYLATVYLVGLDS